MGLTSTSTVYIKAMLMISGRTSSSIGTASTIVIIFVTVYWGDLMMVTKGCNSMGMITICDCLSCMAMCRDSLHCQCNTCFPALSPVVRPVPAVDKTVSQVRRAVRSVAQVPLLVNQPRVFIDRVSVFKRPGERCYSSGKYPPRFCNYKFCRTICKFSHVYSFMHSRYKLARCKLMA